MSKPENKNELVLRVTEIETILDQQDSGGEAVELWRTLGEKTTEQAYQQRKDHKAEVDRLAGLRKADQSLIRRLEETVKSLREANKDLEARDSTLEERLGVLESTFTTTTGIDLPAFDPPVPITQDAGGSKVEKLAIEIEEELEAKKKEVKDLQKDIKAARKKIDELEQSQYEYKTNREENKEELQQSIMDKDRDIGRLKGEIAQLQSKSSNTANSFNARLNEKDLEIKRTSAACERKISQVRALQAKVEDLKRLLEKARNDGQKNVAFLEAQLKILSEVAKDELRKAYEIARQNLAASQECACAHKTRERRSMTV